MFQTSYRIISSPWALQSWIGSEDTKAEESQQSPVWSLPRKKARVVSIPSTYTDSTFYLIAYRLWEDAKGKWRKPAWGLKEMWKDRWGPVVPRTLGLLTCLWVPGSCPWSLYCLGHLGITSRRWCTGWILMKCSNFQPCSYGSGLNQHELLSVKWQGHWNVSREGTER